MGDSASLRARDRALRLALRVGYRVVQLKALLLRRPGHGVKCAIVRDGQVLLVRHTYGDHRVWHLPGGGLRRGEPPAAGADREIAEELGLTGLRWRELPTVEIRQHGRSVTLECFAAGVESAAVTPAVGEIADARWFTPDRLPAPLALEVRRILADVPASLLNAEQTN